MKTIITAILLVTAFLIAGRSDFATLTAQQQYCKTFTAAVTEGQYQRVTPADIIECENAGVPLPVSINTILEYHGINQ